MVIFTFLDWFWVSAYILLMVACGVLFYRLAQRGESDFFLADRGLPWWLPATSVYATHTATDTPIWIGGVIYKFGLSGLWYTFFCAWCAISAFISTRIFRRSLAYTQAEWQSLRYSGMGAELLRGWLAGWQVFMNMFILGWVGIAMGKVFHFLFPAYPEWVGMVLFGAIYGRLCPVRRLLGRSDGRFPAGSDRQSGYNHRLDLADCRRRRPRRDHGQAGRARPDLARQPVPFLRFLERRFPGRLVHHHDLHCPAGRVRHGHLH